MKQTLILLTAFILLLFHNCTSDSKYAPAEHLTPEQIQQMKYSLARYYAPLQKRSTHVDKFEAKYDNYYQQESQMHDLVYYHKDPESGFQYFMLTRIAPSLEVKKVAIAGRFRESKGEIKHYEEQFRTWKMGEKELQKKTSKLFNLYIKGKDLSEYETKNSAPEFWIEFPDERNFFDVKKRQWIYK